MSETFGQRLKRLREAAGLTQGGLMALCGWNGSNSRITNYEKGDNEPKLSDIALMAGALKVTPEYLAYGEVGIVAPAAQMSTDPYPASIEPHAKELLQIMENLPPAGRYRVLATAHEEAGMEAKKNSTGSK